MPMQMLYTYHQTREVVSNHIETHGFDLSDHLEHLTTVDVLH